MSLSHGSSKIVTNGMLLCLDAGNPRSYPGTGTIWYDLTGNGHNGNFINGVSYSSVNGGVLTLDGANSYINIPTINLTGMDYTVVGASRYVSIGGRTFSARNNNWLMGHWSSSTVKHYAVGWVTDTGTTEQSDTNWRLYTATGSFSGDSWTFYVNGNIDTGPNAGGSNGPNGFAIGSYQTSYEFSNSHISFLICYNRILSLSEIKQNYSALRHRFGI